LTQVAPLATDSMMSRSVTTAQWHTYIDGFLTSRQGSGMPAGAPPSVVVEVSLP
jgi:hypothetical protein